MIKLDMHIRTNIRVASSAIVHYRVLHDRINIVWEVLFKGTYNTMFENKRLEIRDLALRRDLKR